MTTSRQQETWILLEECEQGHKQPHYEVHGELMAEYEFLLMKSEFLQVALISLWVHP